MTIEELKGRLLSKCHGGCRECEEYRDDVGFLLSVIDRMREALAGLESQLTEARARIRELENEVEGLQLVLKFPQSQKEADLQKKVRELEADLASHREVLLTVRGSCRLSHRGMISKVLSCHAGSALLERVKKLEKVAEAAATRYHCHSAIRVVKHCKICEALKELDKLNDKPKTREDNQNPMRSPEL